MIRVTFCRPDGNVDREVEAPHGSRLLEVAQAADQPLEGTCEGQMACSTCQRGRGGYARPCRPCDTHVAARVPDLAR
jgi:hypothetical protein